MDSLIIDNKYRSNKLDVISVLLIILLSNTPFFGLIERKKTLAIYLIWTIFILFKVKRINKINLRIAFIFTILFFMNMAINIEIVDKIYLKSILEITVLLFATVIVLERMYIENFIKAYVKIMVVLAATSVVFFLIAIFLPSLVSKISMNMLWGKKYCITSIIYTWGFNSVLNRNSGIFWEPGAYQGFLNIAFIMILLYKDMFKRVKLKLVILGITIITVQSTTGYIIFILILVIFRKRIIMNNNIIKKIIIILLIIASFFVILESGNIATKFSNHNASKHIRFDDFRDSIKMIEDRPIFGYGMGDFKNEQEIEHGIKDNSNGLFLLFYTQGVIIFLYYLYRMWLGEKEVLKTSKQFERIFIFIMFLILYGTESLSWLPFYMIFLFKTRRNDEKNENLYI